MTLTPTALAGRFAAKEALAKALGAVPGGRWVEAVITHDATGAPAFLLRGAVLARAEELGVARIHLSISHDCGVATAMVVLEGKSQVTRYNGKLGAGAVRGATPRHQTSQLFREET
jgi:holo-[acyl-carrier-protein] synthase